MDTFHFELLLRTNMYEPVLVRTYRVRTVVCRNLRVRIRVPAILTLRPALLYVSTRTYSKQLLQRRPGPPAPLAHCGRKKILWGH